MLFRKDQHPIQGAEVHELPDLLPASEVENSHTLIDMSQDYDFFYLGVLIRFTPWLRRDVISDCDQLLVASGLPSAIRINYAEQFVTGVSDMTNPAARELDHQLHAIPKESADTFRQLLAGCAFFQAGSEFFAKIISTQFQIIDPFALKKMRVVSDPPMVDVTFMGLSTTQGCAYMVDSYPGKPRFVLTHPQPGIAATRDQIKLKVSNG